jgi:predicted metal-dependent phosphoesterase TrpH
LTANSLWQRNPDHPQSDGNITLSGTLRRLFRSTPADQPVVEWRAMQPLYDLHSHSTCSDGTLAPAELVNHAADAGVTHLALTDHDCVDGVAEAAAAARGCGLHLVPGVEISVTWQGQTLHVVGLGIDPANAILREGLAGLQQQRHERAERMADRLALKGMDVGALATGLAGGAAPARTHFARALCQAGFARDPQHAFRKLLRRGKPGYLETRWAALDVAVSWIIRAGGQAIIAHPHRYPLSASGRHRLWRGFKDVGGVGTEVVCANSTPMHIRVIAREAALFELLASVGSDYHGPEQRWVRLGQLAPVPAGLTPVWGHWPGTPS